MDACVDAERGVADVEFAEGDFAGVLGFGVDAFGIEGQEGFRIYA